MNESGVMNTDLDDSTFIVALRKIGYLTVKRIFDIVCAIVGCIFLIPSFIIIKICYMLNGDFNSIIYSHERIGKNGKLFKLYKFRSMVPNADKVLEEMLKDPEIEKIYKTNMKLPNDPRITKVGKMIRKTSIDETPQFINVLLGNMSMIGNRPYLPREIKDMGKYYDEIVKTKPGVTGYWQTAGRNNVSFKKRLELESYYSQNASILMDLKIFFRTFAVVFFGKGAQ